MNYAKYLELRQQFQELDLPLLTPEVFAELAPDAQSNPRVFIMCLALTQARKREREGAIENSIQSKIPECPVIS